MHNGSRTGRLLSRWGSLLRTYRGTLLVAPLRIHKFAVVAKANVVAREIVPEKSGVRIVDVGLIVFQRIFIGHLTLEVVSALLAAISDLPSLFVVVGGDRSRGPEMTVTRNFSAIVKVVEHAELQRELVLVGCDVFAVHGKRGIAVADLQVSQNLVVGSIFLDDVKHVLERILSTGE